MYTIERNIQIVIALLKAHGIRKIIISPGTTNIAFVASIQHDNWFDIYSSADERSAAYLACGLAAETNEPVVLSCTGATASRNYIPGLTEAFYRKLPVLAITSCLGNRRIGHLYAQCVDRRSLANDIAQLSVYLPSCSTKDDEWQCEIDANKAILELTRNGGGPVHIDLCTTCSTLFPLSKLPPVRVIRRYSNMKDLPTIPKGRIAIYAGSRKKWTNSETDAANSFCAANNAVVLCDHTSGYYGKYRVMMALPFGQEYYHSPLKSIDLLIHIGEVSGDYYSLSIEPKQVWRVSPDGELRDTFRKLTNVFEMGEEDFFLHYAKDCKCPNTRYLDECKKELKLFQDSIPDLPFSNIWMAKHLSTKIPMGSTLHLGILNSLRAWNFFEANEGVHTYCNVGGFGIDGGLSSLIGASFANKNKLYFGVIGDLAFFYDMNSMGNRHIGRNIRILLVNNGKGTEFRNYHHLGNVVLGKDADEYVAAAGHYGNQSPDLVRNYAISLGFTYMSAHNQSDFLSGIEQFVSPLEPGSQPIVFEVFTNSESESDALFNMLHIQGTAPKHSIGSKTNKIIKKLIGPKLANIVRCIKDNM